MSRGWAILITILLVISMTISIFLVIKTYRVPREKGSANKSTKESAVVFNTGSPFITNIKEDKSVLKCDIYIEVNDEAVAKSLEEDMTQIRDRIITILRDLTVEDVEKQDIQEKLKVDIKKDLKENLEIQNITNIYFNEFIVQY